jgi:hypothetical protein
MSCQPRWRKFFDKENILISGRYQLNTAFATMSYPKGSTGAHIRKKKKALKKEKYRYGVQVLTITSQTPP